MPVTLPPGRLRLVTSPIFTGSALVTNTIGMAPVADFAASADGRPEKPITAALPLTRSPEPIQEGWDSSTKGLVESSGAA